MAAPILCRCGEIVGIRDGRSLAAAFWSGTLFKPYDGPCFGKDAHAPAEVRKRPRAFGLVEEARAYYPETGTSMTTLTYVGPDRRLPKLLARLALAGDGNGPVRFPEPARSAR